MFNLGNFLGGLYRSGAQAIGGLFHPQPQRPAPQPQQPNLAQFLGNVYHGAAQGVGQAEHQVAQTVQRNIVQPTAARIASINGRPIRNFVNGVANTPLQGVDQLLGGHHTIGSVAQSTPVLSQAIKFGQQSGTPRSTIPGFVKGITKAGVEGAGYVAPELKVLKVGKGANLLARAGATLVNHSAAPVALSVAGDLAKGNRNAANIAENAAVTAGLNAAPGVAMKGLRIVKSGFGALGQAGHINFTTPLEKQTAIRDATANIDDLRNQIAIRRNAIDEAKQTIGNHPTLSAKQKQAAISRTVAGHMQAIHDAQVEMGGWIDHIKQIDPKADIPTTRPTPMLDSVPAAQRTLLDEQLAADNKPTLGQKIGQGIRSAFGQKNSPLRSTPILKFNLKDSPGSSGERGGVGLFEPLGTPKISNETSKYVNQMAKDQVAAAKGDSGSKLGAFYREVKTKFVDSAAPIEDVFKTATHNGKDVAPSRDIRYKIDNALRAPTMAGQFVEDHGLSSAIQSVPDLKTFDQYLIARHAQDLEIKGIKTGRNTEADAKLLKELKPHYEKASKVVTAYSRKLLDYATQKGLISKELSKHLKAEYPNYVPVNRIFGEGEPPQVKGAGAGIASKSGQTVVQKIKGSERVIESPLQSLLSKTHDAFRQGEVNDAARTLASYKDLKGNPFNLRELKPSETVGTKSTISFLDGGKKRTFETTPEIANAAKSLNKEQIGLVGKILSYPTRVLRLGATGINLPFVAANMAKDSVTGFINSSNPLRTSVANPGVFLKALTAAVGHGKLYEEMVRNGAGGTSMDIGRDAAKLSLQRIRAERGNGSQIMYTVTHPGELLRAIEDTVARSEEFGRGMQYFGTKEAALAKGAGERDAQIAATQSARTNTTNFARSGDYGRVLNSVLPFFNAGIQGSRTLVRNLKERPAQTAAKIALTTFMPVAATTAWNLSDPQRKAAYDNIKDFEKQGNIIIVPPHPVQDPKTGRWNVIKIPMSQEVANLAGIVRNGIEALHNDKNFDLKQMTASLIGTATSLNVNSGRELMNQLTPQAIKPGVEALTNTNLFTGNTIVPQSLQNFPTSLQYKPTTSGTAVKIGQAIGVSPLMVENTIRTAAGGVGAQALNASDHALNAAGVIPASQVNGTDTAAAAASRFTSAAGTSQAEQDYLAKIQAAKDKNQGKIPKKLQGIVPGSAAPTAADTANGAGSRDVLAQSQARVTKETAKLAPKLDPTYAQTLTRYAKLSAQGKAAFNADPKNKYNLALATYMNDKANGKLSSVKDFSAQQSLAKQAIASNYPQEVQNFHNMSKAQQAAYFKQDPATAKSLYDQAKQLDAQLGGTKYKYGLGTKPKKVKLARAPKLPRPLKLAASQRVRVPKLNLGRKSTLKIAKISRPKAGKKLSLTA